MSDQRSAKIRITDTLLRSVGGRTVLLRIPRSAIEGDVGEQVGLAVPQFQDSELRPAIFRKVRAHITPDAIIYELLVSASAVNKLVGSLAFHSASVLFGCAAGVVIDGLLYTITAVAASEAFDEVYLYRLGLRGPVAGLR